MRGLPFPASNHFDREASNDYGTPLPTTDADIPIDPALSESVIDPAIMGEGSGIVVEQFGQRAPQNPAASPSRQTTDYSHGPQGDPFAPQPELTYFHVEQQQQELVTPTRKPMKRKRRPRREEECGFCEGDDTKNKEGEPEMMVTCDECGRSGHPSCMELKQVCGDVLRSYPWKCTECKTCEICQEKGDDDRILFCDNCDRGWHMDCLRPPLEDSPPGTWHCPLCPPPFPHELHPDPRAEFARPPSAASNHLQDSAAVVVKRKDKGKGRAVDTEESDVDVDVEAVPPGSISRRKHKSTSSGRNRARSSQVPDDVPPPSPPLRPPKRIRVHMASPPPQSSSRMVVRLRLPKKIRDEDEEASKKGIFDDVLNVEERDTSKTSVVSSDKQRFEKSRVMAEEKLAPPPPPPPPPLPPAREFATPAPTSRPTRSSVLQLYPLTTSITLTTPTPATPSSPTPSTPGPYSKDAQPTHQLRIRTLRFGEYDIQTWYDAPFPEEYNNMPEGRLWMCEFCLKYMKSRFGAGRHRMKCKARHPPGDEIYRDGAVSIFEVDGRKNKIYCQNLCLLSKMFLDHKSLFYDVEPFLFYVMTEITDEIGARFVGYFSKEKRSPKDYNVSCIMTLPVRQRKGWGNLLIDFSYLLSKKEQRSGTPERPLSGLGALGYKNYWTLALKRYLQTAPDSPRLEDISAATSMMIEDIYVTLVQQDMIHVRETRPVPPSPAPGHIIKFPKGRKGGIARRHLQRTQTNDDDRPKSPFSPPTHYEIRWDREKVEQYLANWEAKGYLKLKPDRLKWSPFLLARTKKTEGFTAISETNTETISALVGKGGESAAAESCPTAADVELGPSPVEREGLDKTDEQVHKITRSADHPTGIPSCRSPSPRSKEATQLEQDRALAHELANTPPTSTRRLRNRSSYASSADPSRSASRSESKDVEPTRDSSTGKVLGRSTSTQEPSKPEIDVHHKGHGSLEDDEAFAARLAMEEDPPRRQLRSRSSQNIPLSSIATSPPKPSPKPSPRKRRRVESSSPEPDSVSPQVSSSNLSARALRHAARGHVPSSPTGAHKPLSSRQVNGHSTASDSLTTIPQHFHLGLNGVPPKSASQSGRNGHITQEHILPGHSIKVPVENQTEMPADDVKSEDAGTPATALTSRHSVPSDDTICPTPDGVVLNGIAKGVDTPPLMSMYEHRSISANHSQDTDVEGKMDTGGSVAAVDVGSDIDAEGEEDAEGEPDVEYDA